LAYFGVRSGVMSFAESSTVTWFGRCHILGMHPDKRQKPSVILKKHLKLPQHCPAFP